MFCLFIELVYMCTYQRALYVTLERVPDGSRNDKLPVRLWAGNYCDLLIRVLILSPEASRPVVSAPPRYATPRPATSRHATPGARPVPDRFSSTWRGLVT